MREKIVVTGLSIKPRSSHSSFVGAASLFHSHLSFFVKSIRLAFSSFIFLPSLIPSNEYLLSLPLSKRRRKKKPHKHTRAHTHKTRAFRYLADHKENFKSSEPSLLALSCFVLISDRRLPLYRWGILSPGRSLDIQRITNFYIYIAQDS